MSRQNSNRSFLPSHHHGSTDNSSRRYRPSTQNDFSHVDYPLQRQMNHHATTHSNRTIRPSSNSYYQYENSSASSRPHHSSWVDYDTRDHNNAMSRSSHYHNQTKRHRQASNVAAAAVQSNFQTHQNERKRSRNDENQREQHNQSSNYHYASTFNTNPRSRQSQSTNPTTYYTPTFSRLSSYGSHNRHIHQQTSSVTSNHRHSTITSNTSHHRNTVAFGSTSHRSPLFHRTSMTTHINSHPSSTFLLTDLLHRVIDAPAASYYDNYVHYHPSFDMISYAWMSSSHEMVTLPTTFTIQFGDYFDLIIPDETPVVGLTDTELEKLPIIIYKKTSTNIKVDDKCAICLSEYVVDEKLKRLRCKHYFHSECIDPWLKTSTRCPICRGEQTR